MKFTTIGGPPDRLLETLYCFVAVDPKTGLEGLCAIFTPSGMPMQAVTSSPDAVRKIKPLVAAMAKEKNYKVKLVKFTTREILEEL